MGGGKGSYWNYQRKLLRHTHKLGQSDSQTRMHSFHLPYSAANHTGLRVGFGVEEVGRHVYNKHSFSTVLAVSFEVLKLLQHLSNIQKTTGKSFPSRRKTADSLIIFCK